MLSVAIKPENRASRPHYSYPISIRYTYQSSCFILTFYSVIPPSFPALFPLYLTFLSLFLSFSTFVFSTPLALPFHPTLLTLLCSFFTCPYSTSLFSYRYRADIFVLAMYLAYSSQRLGFTLLAFHSSYYAPHSTFILHFSILLLFLLVCLHLFILHLAPFIHNLSDLRKMCILPVLCDIECLKILGVDCIKCVFLT